ncbi:hypothetical protein M409DRAFT_26436 [Zasmidium cellare ATCC 36951]|uniref:Uncharacterized protein n=1 Tax=Zasmidium cellare ATCC 36951 TaxID=1080233 RepID=A0A6A6CB23_ZASCE|nr:uncharacterized protein M409DRAFT_26436 [Zasmidium cellare ATCC 36951]KAF2163400.1 hypothetical protein M409DRAFT_26436 [Zasmidium cellare ATCC 36951]
MATTTTTEMNNNFNNCPPDLRRIFKADQEQKKKASQQAEREISPPGPAFAKAYEEVDEVDWDGQISEEAESHLLDAGVRDAFVAFGNNDRTDFPAHWYAPSSAPTIPTSAAPTGAGEKLERKDSAMPCRPCQQYRKNHVCMAEYLWALERSKGK